VFRSPHLELRRWFALCLLCQKSHRHAVQPRLSAELMPGPAVVGAHAGCRGAPYLIFDTRCVVCHGSVGKGERSGRGNVLDPTPRKFGDGQLGQKSVDDCAPRQTICRRAGSQ